jgi:hypothetical protein
MKNTFTKLMNPKTVTTYLKEAKKVGYIVKKDDMSFIVTDDETTEMIFKGIRMNRTFYAVTFNELYWVQPDRGDGYSASILEEVK